ncbi:MAG: penicillin-binding protein 1A [Myxococcaceae bacterium]
MKPHVPTPVRKGRLILVKVPPSRSGWRVLAAAVAVLALSGGTLAGVGLLGLYYAFSEGLPEIPRVDRYWPPVVTEVFTNDATLAGEFYRERRKVVPYERIPKRLVQAFIASEDASFFDHAGVDFLGTARAAVRTIWKKTTGSGSVQGGSTLTQQTAKAVLISAEGYAKATRKNLTRKIREAILARRLEAALTKEEILYLYLNNVYLGHQSYGVQSAAENYYRKDVQQLTLAEMSLIAGLPQAPSRYSPFSNPEDAKRRRSYVLRRMREEGMISREEQQGADAEEVSVYPVEDVFHEFAPYFTEQVRKDIVARYSNDVLLADGLKVFTTMDAERQRAAQDAMLEGLLAVDKRQGFRGPVAHFEGAERAAFLAKAEKAMGGKPLERGRLYVALVSEVDIPGQRLWLRVGKQRGVLPLLGMRWAHKVNPETYYPGAMLTSVKGVLAADDVIVVRHVEAKALVDDREQMDAKLAAGVPTDVPLFRLEQEPELQGALVSIDPYRQYLVAMVGGYDFDANEFNRAFQACRQPGSAFKPIVYAAALEQLAWTPASILVDSPIVFDDPNNQMRWKPENYGTDFQGDVIVRTALVKSMNIPAVKTFQAVGIKSMAKWSSEFGFSTPMNEDYSAALGSSCVYPNELAQAYATLSRLGSKQATYFVRKIEDRFGRMLEDHTAFDDPWAPWLDRVAASYARVFEPGKQVLSRETGFQVVDMLRAVVKEGTGAPAQRVGKPAAGKTGTTNDSFDAWFAGFTRDLVGVVWVGYDKNVHPLGKFETGGRAALPIWIDYMQRALSGRPQAEFVPDESLALVRVAVDEKTGGRASGSTGRTVDVWFKEGTVPEEKTLEKGQVDPSQFVDLP